MLAQLVQLAAEPANLLAEFAQHVVDLLPLPVPADLSLDPFGFFVQFPGQFTHPGRFEPLGRLVQQLHASLGPRFPLAIPVSFALVMFSFAVPVAFVMLAFAGFAVTVAFTFVIFALAMFSLAGFAVSVALTMLALTMLALTVSIAALTGFVTATLAHLAALAHLFGRVYESFGLLGNFPGGVLLALRLELLGLLAEFVGLCAKLIGPRVAGDAHGHYRRHRNRGKNQNH